MAAILRLTPVLIVDAIEPQLPFWIELLGFTLTDQVPTENGLGFVILKHGNIEVMLQTRSSVAEDVAALADDTYRTALFLEVDLLEPFERRLIDWPKVFERRTTFYGSEEIGVRDPAGNPITLACFARPIERESSTETLA